MRLRARGVERQGSLDRVQRGSMIFAQIVDHKGRDRKRGSVVDAARNRSARMPDAGASFLLVKPVVQEANFVAMGEARMGGSQVRV